MTDDLKISIDLKPIKEDIEKYIKRKIQEDIRLNFDYNNWTLDMDTLRVSFPDIEKRLEKIEDYLNDLKNGFEQLPKTAVRDK